MGKKKKRSSILLIQTPFGPRDGPALGLVRIKSVLAREGFTCDIQHLDHELTASIGEEQAFYFQLLKNSYWLIEAIYAAELFPDHLDEDAFLKRASTLMRGDPLLSCVPDPLSLLNMFHKFNRRVLREWRKNFPYDAIGIGCNFSLIPSLYFASMIKKMHPHVQVILGGNQVCGEVGMAISKTFPFLDWVVRGEGEVAAVKIMNLMGKEVRSVPENCCYRNGSHVLCNPAMSKPFNMEDLPFPDFDDFLVSYGKHGFKTPIQLPLEVGRGCWWGKCAFCGFHPLGKCYRRISTRRIVETMEYVAKRYKIHQIAFVDNLSPPNIDKLSDAISASRYDFNYFVPLKADQTPKVIEALAKAGTRRVFIGIESFSTSTLKRMNKGTTPLDNIVALKETCRLGVYTPYFLMTQFPGETKQEIERTIEIYNLIPHLSKLASQESFYMHYGCPTKKHPERYGLERVWPKSYYNWLLPRKYRFSPTYYWDYSPRVRRRNIINLNNRRPEYQPILELWDKGPKSSFIVDTRWKHTKYVLTEEERAILMACNEPKSHKELGCSTSILGKLAKKKLLIRDCNKYLSLAIIR